jgi:Flp pilus assembly protein TadD
VDFFAQGMSMLRSSARLAAALLIGTALSACSTFTSGTSSDAKQAAAKPAASGKTLAADLDGQIVNAQAMRAQGDYQGATKILSQLMLVAPDNARVVGEYGKNLVQQGRAKEALDFLKRAVELSPGDWSLYSASGVAYDQNGQYAAAKVAYQQALTLRPGNAAVLNNFALSRMQAGDLSGAHQLLAQAQAAGGADPKIASNVALLASLSPTPAAVSAPVKTAAAAPMMSAPKPVAVAAARNTAPKQADTVMMEQIPIDSKAGPVKVATGAPHKLVKETPTVAMAAHAPKAPKKVAAAPVPKKTAAAPAAPKKVAATAAPKPNAKKAPPTNKTPSLRMTADAATP